MTPLDLLAPDQRAVLELILRQDRSYGELSELLGISEREVRDRAEAALRALAGTPDDDVDTGRITDWLLAQQTERAAGATRALLRTSEPARAWAELAAGRLREIGGERLPDVPARDDEAAERPRPRPRRDGEGRRPRPVRDAAPAPGPAATATTAAAAGPAAGGGPRSSRLGGAVLIAVAGLAVAAFLVWFLSRDDSSSPAHATATPAATATPSAASNLGASGNDIVLRPTNGSNAAGLMRLFKAQNGDVQFAIGAQGLPDNKKGEFYAVWFTKKDGSARLLGFPQTQVTNGTLTVGGPGKADTKAFPRWFATYDDVLITRETKARPSRPGPAVLQGTLPHGQG
jgi:Sigma-70, region 4